MTTITSTSATSQYRYTKLLSDTTDDQSISSNIISQKSGTSVSSDTSDEQSLIASAQKLLSQLMSMLMNMQTGEKNSSDQQSSSGESTSPTDIVSAMDTDGDGNVSLDEFVSARPSDVSEDQATNLFNSFDS